VGLVGISYKRVLPGHLSRRWHQPGPTRAKARCKTKVQGKTRTKIHDDGEEDEDNYDDGDEDEEEDEDDGDASMEGWEQQTEMTHILTVLAKQKKTKKQAVADAGNKNLKGTSIST
jgi:hypothetical protein